MKQGQRPRLSKRHTHDTGLQDQLPHQLSYVTTHLLIVIPFTHSIMPGFIKKDYKTF